MTSIGFAILDCFTQALNSKYTGGNWLTELQKSILKKMYSWEENFVPEFQLAVDFNLPEKQIRNSHHSALKRIRKVIKRGQKHLGKIIRIIDGYALKKEPNDIHKNIVRLWYNEMAEVPGALIVRLLARLYFDEREDISATIKFFRIFEKRLNREAVHKRKIVATKKKRLVKDKISRTQILNNVIWFNHQKEWGKEKFEGKEPKRKIIFKEKYHSGKIFSSKCNRDVQYESGIELDFIKQLEINPSVIYYLEQPVTIQYTRHQIDREYTPDFAVLLESGKCFITEIKSGYDDMLDARVHRKLEALIEFCEKNGFGILLTNGTRSIDYLFNYPHNTALEKAIQGKLSERKNRVIFFKEFKELLRLYNASKTAFLALVLKNNWGYYPFPFKLTLHSPYSMFKEKIIDALRKMPPREGV